MTVEQEINDKVIKGTKLFVSTFEREFNRLVKTEMVPAIKKELLAAYDELASLSEAAAPIAKEDPENLRLWRHLFEAQIDKELATASFRDGEIFISVLDKEKLGYGLSDREGDPETVDWLVFYIEGMAGEFAFITRETYEKMRGEKKALNFSKYGRLGKGFLMTKERWISERWEVRTKLKFSDVRHQLSGWRPYNGFETALSRIDMETFINKTLEITTKRLDNNDLQ